LKAADLMLATSDLVEARAARGPGQAQLVAAWNDLRRVMGVDTDVAAYQGRLDPVAVPDDVAGLTQHALQTRPELQALSLALIEAEQRIRLEVANRFGNPSIG